MESEGLEKRIERKLISYIENAPSGIFISDEKGNYILVNKEATVVSGYHKAELLKMNRMQIIHPEDHANATESYKRLFEVGNATLECRIITKNGDVRFLKVNAIKIFGDRYMGIVNDLTEQKLAEEELKRTNNYLQTIVENIPDSLFLKDAKELNYIQFNRAAEELMGIKSEEIVGKNDFSFFPKEQAEFFRQKDREALEGQKTLFIEEVLIQTRLKGKRIMLARKVPIFNADGTPEYLLGISEDITARRKVEKEFMEQKLELDNFFSLSSNLLCIAGIDFSFRKFNSEWGKILGYSTDELTTYKFTDLVHPDDIEQTLSTMRNLSTEQPITNYRNRFRCKDKTYIWIEWQVITNGQLIYATGQDISSKLFYEEQLREAMVAAESANRAKSDFLANMSHEIRNPMNAIIGFAELLHNTIKDEKLLSQVDSIRNSGKNLLGILNDILDLSKIEAGKMKLELEPVNLDFLLKDIENMFSERVREKGLSFCVEKDPDTSLKLVLDEVRFRQILFNLIGNALKFTEKGYICLSIHKVVKSDTGIDLSISIQDTGIGIPKEHQQSIFETFRQQEGQKTKRFGGTGLGLAISKRLAEMMGGKISVISEPGKGSIFTVELYDVKIQHEEGTESEENVISTATIRFEKATVLVVDDTELNLNLIELALEDANLTLLTALNGKQAIEKTLENHPDLILMDLRMPIMDGVEAATIIRGDKSTRSIPIIAISASPDLEIKCAKTPSLFNDYLLKPIKLTDLFELLKKHLPYHTVEVNRQAALDSERKSDAEGISALTDEQKSHLTDVIKVLETEFLPVNKSVIKKQMIEQIESFGKGLISFGEANQLTILTAYGHKICHYTDNFEIDKMMKTLYLFPEIIEKIKAIH